MKYSGAFLAVVGVCTVVICAVLLLDRETREQGVNTVFTSWQSNTDEHARLVEHEDETGSQDPQPDRSGDDNGKKVDTGVWPYFGADLPPDRPKLQTCTEPVKHLVFIKTHKTGSTTVCVMLYRFGVTNNLNIVLPSIPVNVGWPFPLRTEDYIPPKDASRHFDLLVDHTVYHRRIMENLMPADSAYIAMLRHPLHHIKSVFNFYNIPKQLNMKAFKNPLEEFLKNPIKYQKPRQKDYKHKPFSFTRNFMAFDLGFPPGLAEDMNAAQAYVERLDREFDLVIILEYLDESLVLLKRTLCWTIKDILYNVFNEAPMYRYEMDLTPEMDSNYRKWSKVDYLLYEHFNTSLRNRISELGGDFPQEVAHFVTVKNRVKTFCEGNDEQMVIPASKWDKEFSVNRKFCFMLKSTRMSYYKYLVKGQVSKELLSKASGRGENKKTQRKKKDAQLMSNRATKQG
ncbi:galactose-3-O-sulfotransferase 2-like [Branchiostoma floridae]|uniref:Galactose-3-O-sulfotransferase 2-like n=1 Tax=Branchiostoma floridae TaxID=7739 RepID=A0A9J7MG61_BRAFL|nr:galactose-3-O-sulfotransferase 2-like [Branchiostoma floridae]